MQASVISDVGVSAGSAPFLLPAYELAPPIATPVAALSIARGPKLPPLRLDKFDPSMTGARLWSSPVQALLDMPFENNNPRKLGKSRAECGLSE